ncbi:hypothetical protein UMM65_08470 [Aureibaculum sp. 2210JD6-5]|uniref:hypothetical protein n=1 Tax=Aureibaculum sp. 2210JD6-5 TaxID=3103957 RepID=UPI002AAE73CC|nr:hypothetical protein [Aureibaculum sp. 2210JD6-5]MDY7395275.1 hypothetical protein [Aureibaculum sp. 2210JD6-5]
MKTKIINEVGNWNSPWTDNLKKEVESNLKNTIIGEQLLLETSTFKVWSINLPKGESLPFHKHCKPYFYTALNEGKSRSYYSDGKIVDTAYEKNDIAYYNNLNQDNYFIHNLTNIGSTTLVFTTVEFKKTKQ